MVDNRYCRDVRANLPRIMSRKTQIREVIHAFLSCCELPFSAQDCLKACNAQGLNPNKTTIYRELHRLACEGSLVEMAMEGGVRRYELASKAHGHCLVCEGCGDVKRVELPDDLRAREREIESKTNFQIIRHDLTFYGRCRKCRS